MSKWKDKTTGGKVATGLLAATPVGAVALGAKKFHNDRSKRPGWNRKQALRADMKRLQNPEELGLNEDEQSRMLEQRMMDANVQQQAAQSQLERTAMSGQSFQDGTFAEAQQGIMDQSGQAAAAAGADIQNASQAQANAEADRIRASMADQEVKNKENTKYWSNLGINLAVNIATMGANTGGMVGAMGTGPKTTGEGAPAETTEATDTGSQKLRGGQDQYQAEQERYSNIDLGST